MMKFIIRNKNNIFVFLGLLVFTFLFVKELISIPIHSFNIIDIIFAIVSTILIFTFIIELLLWMFKSKRMNNLLFFNQLIIIGIIAFISTLVFGKVNFSSIYGISNLFSERKYDNSTVILEDQNKNYASEEVPNNISNLILTTNPSDENEELGINIFICSLDICSYKYQRIYIGEESYSYVVKVSNGYEINKVIINNISEPKNYFSKIEYNNNEIQKQMFNINLNKILLLSILFIFLFNIIYIFYYKKQKMVLGKFIKKYKISIQKVFVITGLSLGIIFSFIIPAYNVPDEPTHIKMIYESIGMDNVYDDIMEEYDCISCSRTMDSSVQKINFAEYLKLSKKKLDSYSLKNFNINITVIRHLPQTVGIIVGHILKLPIFWMLTLSEIFATIIYIIGGYFVLKIIPFKKNIMFFIMLLPIALQQCSSFSYDSSLNMCCFLVFSLIMKYKFTNAKIDLKAILLILILLFIIAICKLPYILIGLLLLIIPLEKYEIKIGKYYINLNKIVKNKLIIFSLIFFAIILAIIIMPKLTYGRLVIACFLEIFRFTKLLIDTLIFNAKFYTTGFIANFGWLNTPVSKKYTIFVLIYCLFIVFFRKNEKEENFCLKDSIISIVIFVSIVVLLHIVMTTWTYKINNIEVADSISGYRNGLYMIDKHILGVQGRYFIPILPILLFIPKRIKINISNKKYNLINFAFYTISFICCIYILLFRFWL